MQHHSTTSSTTPPHIGSPHAAQLTDAVRLDNVKPTELHWLWPNRIPLGRVTLLVGDPGLGKSLVTLDIAARLTRGTPWPDDKHRGGEGETRNISPPLPLPVSPPPSSVLLLTAEDDIGDTVLPRLAALGADPSKIVAIPAVLSHQFHTPMLHIGDRNHSLPPMICAFNFNHDLSRLNRTLHAMPDCRLVIVDPISAYLGESSGQSSGKVRGLLLQLATLARHHNVALLAVSHLRKKGAAIYRTMGSLAYVAAARAAWVVTRDPECAERRLFMPIKNNLARDVTGLAFTIKSHPTSDQPVLCWDSAPISTSAETIIGKARPRGRRDIERQDAIEWLRKTLAAGPRPSSEVKEEAEAHGISYNTLRRAFRDLRGEAIRVGAFGSCLWKWTLPQANYPASREDAQKSGEELWASSQKPDDFEWPTTIATPAQ